MLIWKMTLLWKMSGQMTSTIIRRPLLADQFQTPRLILIALLFGLFLMRRCVSQVNSQELTERGITSFREESSMAKRCGCIGFFTQGMS
jgi:hypothetical protein